MTSPAELEWYQISNDDGVYVLYLMKKEDQSKTRKNKHPPLPDALWLAVYRLIQSLNVQKWCGVKRLNLNHFYNIQPNLGPILKHWTTSEFRSISVKCGPLRVTKGDAHKELQ